MSRWTRICAVRDIPPLGARVVKVAGTTIAVFRTADDRIFALRDRCPHKGGPLSQGIVHGEQVTCPLHGWVIGLRDGVAEAPDVGCAGRYEVRVEDGEVWLDVTRRMPAAAPAAPGTHAAEAAAAGPRAVPGEQRL
jgi:nitrite reductase (NADH) small subunit